MSDKIRAAFERAMSEHVMEAIDPYDGGTTVCRGCGVHGTFTERPAGDCPTPYKSDRRLLAEALEREAALRAEVERYRTVSDNYCFLLVDANLELRRLRDALKRLIEDKVTSHENSETDIPG